MHLKNSIRVILIPFLILTIAVTLIPTTTAKSQGLSVGELAPNFDVVNIKTNISSQLSDYLGKVIILDLFATWCGPCIEAIPQIARIQNSYNTTDLEIISIHVDATESFDKVVSFAERNNMSWLVIFTPEYGIDTIFGFNFEITMDNGSIFNIPDSLEYSEIHTIRKASDNLFYFSMNIVETYPSTNNAKTSSQVMGFSIPVILYLIIPLIIKKQTKD